MRNDSVIRRRPIEEGPHQLPKDLHPVLQRIYLARKLRSDTQLQRSLDALHPFSALHGIVPAIQLLVEAIQQQRRILIVADFDADGATSCAVGVRALQAMGAAAPVEYLVPDRFRYGYGLTPEIVQVAADYEPDLIITVDNGISSVDGVAAAKRLGIQVLITDHHLPGPTLPAADAIVNPNQPGDDFPSKNLAGVGVIFYVLCALRAQLRKAGWFGPERPQPNLAELLDLVALGTVADVVPLDHTNRILVAQGLARIRAGQGCPGISALIDAAGRYPKQLVGSDLGFYVGPRLNAAGRMDDMSIGINCLLSTDPDEARALARQLDSLNRQRREVEAEMQTQALEKLTQLEQGERLQDQKNLPWGLCLYDEEWHQGVIGLLASRIKERLHRPVIALAPGDNGEIKGSARSIPGLHIRDTLDTIASRYPGLVTKFGGHAMAAGLSFPEQHLDRFTKAFDKEVRRRLNADHLQDIVWTDGELQPEQLDLELAETLRAGGPWGQGFPEPLFDGEFDVLNWRIVGQKHLKMQLAAAGQTQPLDAIAFNMSDQDLPAGGAPLRAAYRLEVNQYRGKRSAQLLIHHIEPV